MARGVCRSVFFIGLLVSLIGCGEAVGAPQSPTAVATSMATPLLGATATPMPITTFVPPSSTNCPVTPLVKDSAPRDPNASPVSNANWYINPDRTLWAGSVPADGWHAGGEKTYWVRPAGTALVITGDRLDAEAPPLHADIPCCYPTGFQIVDLIFPTQGCWEIQVKAGSSELHFVTEVNPADHPAAGGSCVTLADVVKLSDAIVVGTIKESDVERHYAWLNIPLQQTWKAPPGWSGIGDRFVLLQDLHSEPKLEQNKQYVLFIQYTPWRLVCAPGSVIEINGDQTLPLGSAPLWKGGNVIELKKEIDRLLASR